jgi:GntR family transcriptional repressor for pyruvate dehydrogenase complex
MITRPPLAPRRTKVREEIVEAIQRQIRQHQIAPGARLPAERRLADQFGASRGSVREALRALELSGFITSRHGGGTFVAERLPDGTTLSLAHFLERHRRHLLDLSEARQMFEPRLAWLAAERGSREDLTIVRRALDDQRSNLATDDVEAAFAADRAFHQAIAEATHNQTFIMLHNHLSDLIAGGRREAIENDSRRTQSPVDHETIYEAIARGDGPAASAAMLQHLRNVEAILISALMSYQRAITKVSTSEDAGPAPFGARPRSRSRGTPSGRRD